MDLVMSLNICVNRCSEEQMIPRLARAGFTGLDFNFCDMVDRLDWDDESQSRPLLDRWKSTAAAANLKWLQAHGPMFNMFGSTPRDQKARNYSTAAIKAAGHLGIPWMVFHPDVFPGPFDRAHRQAIVKANVDFFRTLLPTCEKTNVGIAIENIFDAAGRHGSRGCPRFFGALPEELCELIDAINHPLIGACWDTGHARIMGLDPGLCLPAVGHRLKALHIQENDGKNDDHMLPFANGRDGVDWNAVVLGLRQANYAGPFTYEVHNAINAVPDDFLDTTLTYAASIAAHLANQIHQQR